MSRNESEPAESGRDRRAQTQALQPMKSMCRAAMMVVAENQESDTVLSVTDPFRQRQLYDSVTPDDLREVQALLHGLAQAVRRTISERASSQARRPGAVE